MVDIWPLVRDRRRSSGSFGRIEIRSSSEDSQFIMLRNRSRFPLKRMMLLATQPEEPVTTKRPSFFPASAGLGSPGLPLAGGALSAFMVPATAMVNGPFLFLEGSILISGDVRFVVAKLLPLVASSFSAVAPVPD